MADSSRAFTAVTEGHYCHHYHHHLPPDVSYGYKWSSPLFQLMMIGLDFVLSLILIIIIVIIVILAIISAKKS